MNTRHTLFARWLMAAAGLILLAFGLWLYSRPDMAVLLAEQLWACF